MKIHNNPIDKLLLTGTIFEEICSPKNPLKIRPQGLSFIMEVENNMISNQSFPDKIRKIFLQQLGLTLRPTARPTQTSPQKVKLPVTRGNILVMKTRSVTSPNLYIPSNLTKNHKISSGSSDDNGEI
jgi:hypothetical protein